MKNDWDCIVVGGGAAGLSAALTLGRARRRTLVVDAGAQSNLAAEGVGGLLGHDGRSPAELYRAARDELAEYPSVSVRNGVVVAGADRGGVFELVLDDGSRPRARRVILATGVDYVPPDVAGVPERWGRSVFHCPFCHAWELRDRPLGVIDRMVERALLLKMWSDDVTLFTNGSVELAREEVDRLKRAGIKLEHRAVKELRGNGSSMDAVILADGTALRCEGLLVPAMLRQRSDLAQQLGARSEGADVAGLLSIDEMYRTSVAGLFAAGDVGRHFAPSVASAIAAGAAAAKSVVHDLLEEVSELDPAGSSMSNAAR